MQKWVLLGGIGVFAAMALAAFAGAYFMISDEYEFSQRTKPTAPASVDEFSRTPQTVFAAETPDWIKDAYTDLAGTVYSLLEKSFDRKLSQRPTVFIVMAEGEDNRFGFTGRARYGEVIVTLAGGAWQKSSPEKLDLFRRGMAHEFVHLWQWDSVGTNRAARMTWINEGVAQAIAAELMMASGYWDENQRKDFRKKESKKCADGLAGRALADATERTATDDAYYGCGFVIADVVSKARGETVLQFWREFFIAHQMQEYFEEEDFFDFIRLDTNDAIFTAAVDLFVNKPHRDPSFAIDNLYGVAERSNARRDQSVMGEN
ncbi:MAG: hypothetical protein HKP25_08370 [Marinicaulis sp.]|nr:hypothetical protein [Marinicaulis sp.]